MHAVHRNDDRTEYVFFREKRNKNINRNYKY